MDIKRILDFYVNANNMKIKGDLESKYSVADNVYGSIILAVAIDSEYNESKDLGNIIKMLVLDGFNWASPEYDFDKLKLGSKYIDKINEYNVDKTIDAKNAKRYNLIDESLTILIDKYDGKVSYEEMKQEAVERLKLLGYPDDEKNKEIFKFYYSNFTLKNKVRSGWDNKHWNVKSDVETVSEHVVSTIALSMALESELNHNEIDYNQVIKTLAIHEIGEIVIGDITPFDGKTKEEKQKEEHVAMCKVLGDLSKKEALKNNLFEFDKHVTPLSIYCYFIDKIEADLQAKLYQDKGLQHNLDDQPNNVVLNCSKIIKMIEEGATTVFEIWFGYDKEIYMNNTNYPEFLELLYTAAYCDLLNLNVKNKQLIYK